ncbi:4'-phosphopantetheinyl transferase superfamily protein [uncultured Kordia sp.]|uniref:4'-phosphopantetheinyl transferase family protein n=1 Tax=uncultured Kordia sp. TaxID=507699 RepID=UPI0026345E05|nr:4'-phosphopantetheinyl transferase superfamily protein [uncultured Kordia sp.]
MIHILWCKIDLTQDFFPYLKKIPKSLQNDILRYRRTEDQWSKLLGKLLLVYGMKSLGYKEIDLNEIEYTVHNRPYLDEKPDFNISHSGTYVVCAFSNTQAIGVDIEEIKNIDLKDFKHILSQKEWSNVINAHNSLQQFYSYWTGKESLLKADGRGITVELDKVNIQNTHGTFENKEWFLQEINFNPAYAAHIASTKEIEEIQITEIKINQLL